MDVQSPETRAPLLTFDSNMQLDRRTPTFETVLFEQTLASAKTDSMDDSEEFTDAREMQSPDRNTSDSAMKLADGELIYDQEDTGMGDADAEWEEDDRQSEDGGSSLFADAFGGIDPHAPIDDEEKEDGDEGTGSMALDGNVEDARPDLFQHIESEHVEGCTGVERAVSTPPGSPIVKRESSSNAPSPGLPDGSAKASTASVPAGPREPNPEKDKSPSLLAHERFHKRAFFLRPRLELASHRYWIGVLRLGKKPKDAREEKHFVWMRGNRLSTVQTVWNEYQTTTFDEGFQLMLGYEEVEFKDRVEELDYFNDKFVCFRAVAENSKEAKGREISEGIIPEEPVVIVIDDD